MVSEKVFWRFSAANLIYNGDELFQPLEQWRQVKERTRRENARALFHLTTAKHRSLPSFLPPPPLPSFIFLFPFIVFADRMPGSNVELCGSDCLVCFTSTSLVI